MMLDTVAEVNFHIAVIALDGDGAGDEALGPFTPFSDIV
jgi:hypothetical protein